MKILFFYMDWSASRGFPLLRKAISLHVKNYHTFSHVFEIANQLLTRHSLRHERIATLSLFEA